MTTHPAAQSPKRHLAVLSTGCTLLLTSAGLASTTNNVIGVYPDWPTAWQALSGLNDSVDSSLSADPQLDFVGDATNAGAYYASTNGYVFFRQRVQVGTVISSTFTDAHFVLINLIGSNYISGALQAGADDSLPDYSFTWDSKSNNNTKHGLEMQVRSTVGTEWKSLRMADLDGNDGSKLISDINGNSRTTDGYLRTIDQKSTTNFGMTTFIDYAVSWSYLKTYTGLTSNQTWHVTFGSLHNSTDHNAIDGDIAGGANPTNLVTQGWVSLVSTPTSSGIDLRAYQGAGGVYVEFVAYDVEEDGSVSLAVLGADGKPVWTGTTNVLAGARYVCRFQVPGLTVGSTYTFAVRDEVGKGWTAPGVTVSAFAAEMVSLSLTGITLSFGSLPDREYEIQWTARLGADWQTVTTLWAESDRTRVFVTYPEPQAPAGFFRIRMK